MNRPRPITVLFALALLPTLAMLLIVGCADTYAGKAEQTHQAAFEAADAFLLYEHEHRDELPPKVTAAADEVRRKGPPLFTASWDAIQAYKADPTPAAKREVSEWLGLIADVAARAREGYAEARRAMLDRRAEPNL